MTKKKSDVSEWITAKEASTILTTTHGRFISPGYICRVRNVKCKTLNKTTKIYLRSDIERARIRYRRVPTKG